MTEPQHAFVALERDDDGYPPFDREEIDVRWVEKDVFEVLSIPVFLDQLAHGDLVQAVRLLPEGELWIKRVVREGDGWNARVVPLHGQALESIEGELSALGGRADVTQFGIVKVTGEGSPPGALVTRLMSGLAAGEWEVGWGVAPPGVLDTWTAESGS